MLEAAIEAGAEDVTSDDNGHQVFTTTETLRDVAKALEAKYGEARKALMMQIAQRQQELQAEMKKQNDDLQKMQGSVAPSAPPAAPPAPPAKK